VLIHHVNKPNLIRIVVLEEVNIAIFELAVPPYPFLFLVFPFSCTTYSQHHISNSRGRIYR